MATLERRGPSGLHGFFPLDDSRDRISVGRDEANVLVIDNDTTVSRLHAFFERVGAAWCITDMSKTNGTTLNGERVFGGPHVLADRDEIIMGRTRLILHDPGMRGGIRTLPVRQAPPRTPREQDVLRELCRPMLTGNTFCQPASRRAIAHALFIGEGAVQQHFDHLYDKFDIPEGPDRRMRLANEAIERGAVGPADYQ